ncbi:MAG: XRE family transcriptional regulator [Comamonadaceae bacterium]|nr:MAG: XRE family transcriptional regulator [Comamonadaceae bacterium]
MPASATSFAPSSAPNGPPAVGPVLQSIRQAQKLSLDDLSKLAGVSKSMLSQIERNQANPTVAILWRLSNALRIELTQFLSNGVIAGPAQPASVTVVPSHALPSLRSPDGKCSLRILGPIELAGKMEWYELTMQPGGVLGSDAHDAGTKEHLTLLSGTLIVRVDADEKRLRPSETARYPADVAHSITNAGRSTAVAMMFVEHTS